MAEIVARSNAMLQRGEYRALETWANHARKEELKFPSGKWELAAVYYGVSRPPSQSPSPEDWVDRIDLLARWRVAIPESASARVALADAYASYGAYARGIKMAAEVRADQWEVFRDCLALAKEVLDEIPSSNCPGYFKYLIESFPGEPGYPHQLCRLAVEANDMPTAHRLFQEMGPKADIAAWKDQNKYDASRKMAQQLARFGRGEIPRVELYQPIKSRVLQTRIVPTGTSPQSVISEMKKTTPRGKKGSITAYRTVTLEDGRKKVDGLESSTPSGP